MYRAAPELFGESWRPELGLIEMRTLPRPHEPRSPQGRAILARYEASNPRWREGYGALFVAPIGARAMAGIVGRLLRRGS